MKLSLILATVDRTEDLDRFVNRLAGQTDKRFELIIVDQNTDDRLLPIVKRAESAGIFVRHIRFAVRSLAAARNHGLPYAAYDLVAFPDDDCWYEQDVVERIIRRFSEDSSLSGIQARWAEAQPRPGDAYQLSLKAWRKFRGIGASSITLFLRASLVKQLGGFDARLGVPGWFGSGEEIDLVLRGLDGGAKIKYAPEVIVHHAFDDRGALSSGAYCRKARIRARGVGAIFVKHRLSLWVMARGILSPLVKLMVRPWQIRNGMRNLCVAFGILEGMANWVYRERHVDSGAGQSRPNAQEKQDKARQEGGANK